MTIGFKRRTLPLVLILGMAFLFCFQAAAADFTKAEINSIKEKVLPPGEFRVISGRVWGELGGSLYQLQQTGNPVVFLGSTLWDGDFTLECKARRIGGKEGFIILFRVQDEKNYCWWSVGGWGNTQSAVERKVDGDGRILEIKDHAVTPGQWHDIKITAQGDIFRFYFDGAMVYEVEELDMTYGCIGLGTWETQAEFKDVKYSDGSGAVRYISSFAK